MADDPISNTVKRAGDTVKSGSGEGLKKMVGPLPLSMWLLVVGGALVISFYVSKKNASKTTSDGTNTDAPTALVYTGTGGGGSTSNDTTTGTAPTGYQTNEAWAMAAKQYLISQGVDGKEASDAIDLYINAQALNAKQNADVAVAIRALGAPPQSLPPTTGTPGTGTPTVPSNPTGNVWGTTPRQNPQSLEGTTYVVKDGDTLVSIARKAYGLIPLDYSNAVFGSNEILNANHDKITDALHLTPGMAIYVPVLSSQDFPGFYNKVPQFGFKPGDDHSTGEWQIDTGLIPQSANAPRTGH